jgi:hypothetical protein
MEAETSRLSGSDWSWRNSPEVPSRVWLYKPVAGLYSDCSAPPLRTTEAKVEAAAGWRPARGAAASRPHRVAAGRQGMTG